MKLLGAILVIGGLAITMQENPILALIYIGLGIFLLKKYKHQRWLPGIANSKRQQKKELRSIEVSKINELKSKRAFRKFNVAGITYENRQYLLDTITRKYHSEGIGNIEFIPEPNNKYDPNALKVVFENIGHIGYVPKERVVEIGELLNKSNYDIKWNINHFYDEEDHEDDGISYMEIRLYTRK